MDIAKLRELEAAATAVPWAVAHFQIHGKTYGIKGVVTATEDDDEPERLLTIKGSGGAMSFTDRIATPPGTTEDDANFALIVAMRNALPELLDKIDALEKLVEPGRAKTHSTYATSPGVWRVECIECGATSKGRQGYDAMMTTAVCRAIWNRRSPPPAVEGGWRFKRGDYVRKVVGSKWNGRVVGFYTTELTQRGYAVESMYEIGSVQIYPEKALELFSVAPTPPAGEKP